MTRIINIGGAIAPPAAMVPTPMRTYVKSAEENSGILSKLAEVTSWPLDTLHTKREAVLQHIPVVRHYAY